MKRRDFFKSFSSIVLLGAVPSIVKAKKIKPEYNWKMVTTWPKNFPGLGTGAQYLADTINKLSGGRIKITVYGAGELVPAFEIFDAVSNGVAELGHGSAYYWKGKNDTFQFFSTVPFGMTANEMNSWLYKGGGMNLWQQAYERFNLLPMAAGNTGIQMGGWFNKEINSLNDLKGLKMRIPGLGGEVLKRAGGTPVNLPGGELFTALKTGTIDATEWVSPYNDLAFGLHKAAKYYYYPGWHEPGTCLEAFINLKAWQNLDNDLKRLVEMACKKSNADIASEFFARNGYAIKKLRDEFNVNFVRYENETLKLLKRKSDEVLSNIASKDKLATKIFNNIIEFRKIAMFWSHYSEKDFLEARQY